MDLKKDSLVPCKIFARFTALFRHLLQEIITIEHTLFIPKVQIKADFTINSPFRFIIFFKSVTQQMV